MFHVYFLSKGKTFDKLLNLVTHSNTDYIILVTVMQIIIPAGWLK